MNQIIPSFGTREVLFNFPQFFYLIKRSCNCFYKSFYQIYEGAGNCIKSRSYSYWFNKRNNFKAYLSDEDLKMI